MTRTLATATAIATALIAISPASHAGQMINVPTPQVNVAPNVPRPHVNLPAVTPRPDLSRVLKRDEGDDSTEKDERADTTDRRENTTQVADQPSRNERTEALTDRAPVPPAFPETLVKAMDAPRFKPWDEPDAELMPIPAPVDEGDADDGNAEHLGHAGEIDTDGADGDAVGTGNNPPLGLNEADYLREQFRGGVGVEKAEELARLKELQEIAWLEFGDSAFAGDGDCGPGVNLPSGMNLHGLGCGSGDGSKPGPTTGSGGNFGVGYPLDPRHEGTRYPRPSPEDGMGSNNQHPDARIGGGGSAKGTVGIKDVGQGQASMAGCNQLKEMGFVSCNKSDDGNDVYAIGKDKNGNVVVHSQHRESDGSVSTRTTTRRDNGYTRTECHAGECETHEAFDEPYEEPDMTFDLEESEGDNSGGEAGQGDPRGDPQGSGGAGQDCLMLGIRCDVAEGESGETTGERMKEWARTLAPGGGGMTPGKVMEQAGQPVPVPGRENGADAVEDLRAEAGLTPGCDADPGGCGGGVGGSAAAGAAADDALDDVAIDTSIAGLTPGCDADPGGCGGNMGAAVDAAAETGAGEATR